MSRFHLQILLCVLWSSTALAEDSASLSPGPDRPNIILIMSDDQGWGDTGFNGHPDLKTPNLDRLAASGAEFTRFYAAAPVCSPTRASVLTGRHPKRQGIDNPNDGKLRTEEITLAEIARELGYTTAHFGKWHLGTMTHQRKDSNRGDVDNLKDFSPPWDHGYDWVFATEAKVPTFNPMVDPEGEKDWYGAAYWTGSEQAVPHTDPSLLGDDSRVLMDRVLPFLQTMAFEDQRFFATLWLHSPHDPVIADPADKTYAGFDHLSQEQKDYYTIVTQMDQEVGRLLDHLEKLGLTENTLVAFTSDNGPSHVYSGSAGGLRGFKQDLYEGGIRVPGLLSWPGVIPAGIQVSTPVITHDYLPTMLDIWGIAEQHPASARPLDGRSMMPLLKGESLPVRELEFGFSRYDADKTSEHPQRMALIRGYEKIVTQDYGENWAFFDLKSDPEESTNLADTYPDRVETMTQAWMDWFEETRRSRDGADY